MPSIPCLDGSVGDRRTANELMNCALAFKLLIPVTTIRYGKNAQAMLCCQSAKKLNRMEMLNGRLDLER
jgi:hypothetical protein